MDYMEFASDLPLNRTFMFSSAEENEETLKRWGVTQTMRQLGTGTFRSDLAVRITPQVELYADRFNKAVSMCLAPAKDTVGILIPRSESGKFLLCGQDIGNEKLVVIPHGSEVDITIPDLAGSDCMSISIDRFIALTEVLAPAYVQPEGFTVIDGNLAQLYHLRKVIINLVANPEVELSDEQLSNLLAATIAWITDSTTQQSRSKDLITCRARMRIAKLAQEYIEAHYQEAIHMEDLCRITGVGLRTLQRYFRDYFDLTISEYLKTVRLYSAHRELTTGTPFDHTVTYIAMEHGFNHLGRFSAEFHERFGELPSETLAMHAGQKS